MAIVKAKPTSPGRRFVVKITSPELHKGRPHAPLVELKSKTGGRNNQGRITTRHKGGGHKRLFRDVDFLYDKKEIPAKIKSIDGCKLFTLFIKALLPSQNARRTNFFCFSL